MLDIESLKEKKITELNKIAQEMKIPSISGLKKSELIFRILEEQTAQEGLIFFQRRSRNSSGRLRVFTIRQLQLSTRPGRYICLSIAD